MAYVKVPKDLTKVKTKVALNMTKRQLIGFSIARLEPLREAQDLEVARADRVHERVEPRAVHERRAGTLVARVLRKVAYERHLRAREQWQQEAIF